MRRRQAVRRPYARPRSRRATRSSSLNFSSRTSNNERSFARLRAVLEVVAPEKKKFMEDLATIAFYFGVIAYSVATTLFFIELARREGSPLAQVWAPRALGLGAALHSANIVTASLLSRVCPVESLHFALSLSALFVAGVYLILRRRLRLHVVGAVVAPLALTFLVAAQFVNLNPVPAPEVPR